jgi:predicted nucleotidyltransferase
VTADDDLAYPRWALVRDSAAALQQTALAFGVTCLALTGSVARGVDHDASDVDFWIADMDPDALATVADETRFTKSLAAVLGMDSVDVRPQLHIDDAPWIIDSMRCDAIALSDIEAGVVRLPSSYVRRPLRIEVAKPHGKGSGTRDRTGTVSIRHESLPSPIGTLSFDYEYGTRVLRTTDYSIPREDHRDRGYPHAMTAELLRSFRGVNITFSGVDELTTSDGRGLLASLQKHGLLIHAGRCFRSEEACVCPLRMDARLTRVTAANDPVLTPVS